MTDEVIGKIMRRACERKLMGNELGLLLRVATRTGEKGYCDDSNEILAQLCQCGERAIRMWLATLQVDGYVNVLMVRHRHERRIYINGIGNGGKYNANPSHLSPKQKAFHDLLPNIEINCEVPDDIDFDLLITKIKNSSWLQSREHHMTLKSYVYTCYKQIMNDVYSDEKWGSKATKSVDKTENIKRVAENILRKRKIAAEEAFNQTMKPVFADANYRMLQKELTHLMIENSKKAALGLMVDETTTRELTSQISEIMQKHGVYSAEPNYSCKKCKDSGYVHGQMCECLKEEILKQKQLKGEKEV